MTKPVAQEDVTILKAVLPHVPARVVYRYEIFVYHVDVRCPRALRHGNTDGTVAAA